MTGSNSGTVDGSMGKPSWLQDWIAALRSGKYKQGKGYLCSDGAYCCLGVLCDIQNVPPDTTSSENGTIIRYEGEEGGLPDSLAKRLDITSCGYFSGDVLVDGYPFNNLADLNDSGLADFNKIADILERASLASFC